LLLDPRLTNEGGRMAKEEFRICPFCKSKIPASLDECPICHRVIVERFENKQNNENTKNNVKNEFLYQNISDTSQNRKHHFPKIMKRILWVSAAISAAVILGILIFRPGPLTYRLGSVDERFNISNDQAISIINDAAQRWNEAAQKEILKYDPKGKVVINFVYDYRQEYVDAKKQIESEYSYLSAEKKLLDEESQNIDLKKNEIAYEYERLNDEIDSLNIDLANYNSKVNYWNRLGGAPTYVYTELENERKELNRRRSQIQAEINKLNDKENELNKETEEYNEKTDEYNKKVDERNAKMDAIRNLFLKNQNDSDEITLGEYDENTNTITIYSFEDLQTLRLVLMHEFGHSLGAKHAQNKNSIMFPILNDVNVDRSNPYPSAEDLKLIGIH